MLTIGKLGQQAGVKVPTIRYYEQLDDESIAELLNCSPATVRSQASKALKTLRLESEREILIPAEEKS